MKADSIHELVKLALGNKFATYSFSLLPAKQAQIIEKHIGLDLTGTQRIIDTYGIRHALLEHGWNLRESQRGQAPLNLDDFELIPSILREPDKITYAGKNSLKQDVFKYEKRIGTNFIVVEAVRVAKQGNKLVFQTMYKKK